MQKNITKLGLAYSLWAFGGIFGAHRFYLGRYITGAMQFMLLTVGASMFLPEAAAALQGQVTVKALVGDLMMMAAIYWALADGYFIWRFTKPTEAESKT